MTLQHLTEADFQQLKERVQGGVVSTRRESIGSKATMAQADSSLSPRRKPRAVEPLPVRSMPVIGRAGSNPAPAPFFPLILALTGQLPSGKNRVLIRRDGHHYPDKHFTNWRARAYGQILEQVTRPIGKVPLIIMPICLTCDYWPSDHRTRDVSGQLDALFHVLVYAKVLKDDGLIYDVRWRRHDLNKKFPKVVMEVEAWPT